MGLTGSLKEFGLTDLFQVLGQQQKTGVLNLQGDEKAVQVFFDKGMIVKVEFPEETGEEIALGRRLIRGRLISAENWRRAYQQHEENLVGLEKVLVGSGLVTKEDLSAALRLLTVDTLYALFKWKRGNFRFETRPVSYDPEFVEPMHTEFLLLDVLRMVDEWPMLQKRLSSFDLVLRKVNPIATLDSLMGTPLEKNRSFQMEVIYDLVDGQRSVKEIIDLSFVEEFETCKNLILLMDAGLVESPAGSVKKEPKGERKSRVAKHLADAGAYLLVGMLALLLLFQFTETRLINFPLTYGEWQGWRVLQDSARKVYEVKVRNAREVFSLEENRFPQDPSELVSRGLLPY
jgi:hypothetical protein